MAITDEVTLQVEGYVSVDPADWIRLQAQSFLASHQWTTEQIFYGDQTEAPEEGMNLPGWSVTFALGLDHIKTASADWRSDVSALLIFVQSLQAKLRNEFVAEVRYRSELWRSEHIAFIDEKTAKIGTLCDMIERVV